MGVEIRGIQSRRDAPSLRDIVIKKYPQMQAYYDYVENPENKVPRDQQWTKQLTPRQIQLGDEFLTRLQKNSKSVFDLSDNLISNVNALDQVTAAKLIANKNHGALKNFISTGGTDFTQVNNEVTFTPFVSDILATPLIASDEKTNGR